MLIIKKVREHQIALHQAQGKVVKKIVPSYDRLFIEFEDGTFMLFYVWSDEDETKISSVDIELADARNFGLITQAEFEQEQKKLYRRIAEARRRETEKQERALLLALKVKYES